MPNFPKYQDDQPGPLVDNGSEVGQKQNCPNCGSNKYRQTVSIESCPACGLEFRYWRPNVGGNAVYEAWAKRAREERMWAEHKAEQAALDTDPW